MKKHITRVLALAVALLVLCAPIGALAEEHERPGAVNATLELSNFHLMTNSFGEENEATVDITARLDLSADLNDDMTLNSFAATLTALSGKNKAIKGGLAYDGATMDLTAGLEGMTDAVLLPMAEIIRQAQAQTQARMEEFMPGGDMDKVQNLIDALENLQTAAENADSTALQTILMDWVNEQFVLAESGVSCEAHDTTFTADRYDFEITAQELVLMGGELVKAVQADLELTAAVQAYVDAVIDLTGEEDVNIDLANLDIDALLADMPEEEVLTLAGSFYTDAQGNLVLDMTMSNAEYGETRVIPYRLVILNGDESVYIGYASTLDDDGMVTTGNLDINIGTGDAAVFNMTYSQVGAGDGVDTTMTMVFSVDRTEDTVVTLYIESSNAFTYNEKTYNSLQAYGVNYAGTTVADDSGIAWPGTLTLYVNQDGMETTVSADTRLALTNESSVTFNMPNNLINILEADADTQEALRDEFMETLSKGYMMLLGAPGMGDITAMMGR